MSQPDQPADPDNLAVGDRSGEEQPREGEHVVVTSQTAGSAGAAHSQED